ncbi:S-layer homology domain-containing protein [Sedimentibacter sp. MB31-C6]|uniref:S-layer homology domain-containing protein n=1 Tax=Sedimentibacter sp. MB31-C6 TaxID=3109366 RepID=UPI002DDD949C|nr:S-layer homology domain-containing protein [Sedimentibacter sp. MB36-C1]WSI05534.1 S-layer homology domain-containing protein [Sedimentibacter sp. MB36-C1]
MKKLLSLLIILIFAFSAIVNVYAYSFPDINNDPILIEAVDVLSSYGIIQGYPDNNFMPDKIVSRAEMAKIVTIASGYSEYSKNMTSVYDDMKGHWAESYVELADVLNLVKGISKNTYGPDNYIKFEEAYTMILRLLGYTDESLIGRWPTNFYEKATELNLFKNVDPSREFATRKDISIMLYNALTMDLVKVRDNNTAYNTGKNLLSLIGKMETREVTLSDLKDNDFNFTKNLFNKWDVYYDKNNKVVHVTNPRYNEFTGTVNSLLSNRVIFVTDDYGNVRAFKLPNIPIVFNGAIGNFNSLENSRITIVYEDNSFNGDVIGVIANKVTDVVIVESSELYNVDKKTFAGKNLPLKSNNEINYNKIFVRGDAQSLEDIKENDLVYLYETDENNKKSSLEIEVVRSQVEGKVSNVQIEDDIYYYTIYNTVYKSNESFNLTDEASVNDTVNFILDKNNDIVKLNIIKYGKAPTTYGLVLSSSDGTNNATVRIFDEYGNLKTYSLANNSSVVKIEDSKTKSTTTLNKNDIVKFDPVSSGDLKIIDNIKTVSIKSNYNEQTMTLSNGNKISPDTFIIYESYGKYQLLKPNQLSNYLEGKAVVNYYGHINALYLTNGIKDESNVTHIPEVPQSYNGTIYDIIKSVKKVDDTTSKVEFFNNNNIFLVSNSSSAGKKIANVMNSYVKIIVVNGTITSIEKVTPETQKIEISAVYTNQFLIDNITYMEYSPNIQVYNCTTDKTGNFIDVNTGTKDDIKSGSNAQLYDLYGGFDGIIDVVLIFD